MELDSPLHQALNALEERMDSLPSTLEEQVQQVARMAAREVERRWKEEEEAKHAEMERRREERVRQVLRRMMHKLVSMTFDAWMRLLNEAKGALKRAASTWKNVSSSRAWRKWADMAYERSRLLAMARRVVGRMRNQLLSMVFTAWADDALVNRRAREAELQALKERREDAAKEAKFLAKLTSMGTAWFSEMEELAELTDYGGPKGLINAIHEDVGAAMAEEERQAMVRREQSKSALIASLVSSSRRGSGLAAPSSRRNSIGNAPTAPLQRRGSWQDGWSPERRRSLRAEDEAIVRLRDRMNHRTVLDLLDSRYMAPGGQLHGRHIEAEFTQLRESTAEHLQGLNDQYAYLRTMFQKVVKASGSPIIAAIEKEPRERKLRPLKPPPRFAELAFSISETLKDPLDSVDNSSIAQKGMATSKSSAAVLSKGGGGTVLKPVRSPRGAHKDLTLETEAR